MTGGPIEIEYRLSKRLSELKKALTDLTSDLHEVFVSKTSSRQESESAFKFDVGYVEDQTCANQNFIFSTERRESRPPMPDSRLIRKVIKLRQRRLRYFDANLFADPAWDMLLDLAAAREEHTRVSVTSLCIASGVPPTTALRWIGQMIESGLLIRTEDSLDKRRAFMTLTDRAADAISRYFADISDEGLLIL
ncbi:MAG: hypothetical protein KGZ65_13245 [Sphingomonadales bacterium]|nr:hypothetical protein [Sphingomonadaceae bacterium]MBS3932189.1 hypothetical protein [Sphingomonadales bacterium]